VTVSIYLNTLTTYLQDMIDYINLRLGFFDTHVETVNGLNSTLSLL
jgi:hypothetical protein